jgi:hypothetical protein
MFDSSESMSLEEARSVMWLRNNHRPLGELLDEGFLTEARLAWAAEKAYDPRLKQAAAVLLDWVRQTSQMSQAQEPAASPQPGDVSRQTINAGITVEQARATPWPFRPFKGQPMGDLVDARQLAIKDLGYAIESAWDERVRRAAVALAALRLNQVVDEPAPPAGPLRVISAGRSYAERRQFLLTMIQGLIMGGVLGTLVPLLVQELLKPKTADPSTTLAKIFASPGSTIAFIIAVLLLAGVAWLTVFLPTLAVKKLDRQIESHRKGQEGEERVVEVMRQNLDSDWTVFRNVTMPGRSKADMDAVLVGPPGVWALEIKNLSGVYRNVGERWEFRTGGKWKGLRRSPGRQATDNAARLGRFLEADRVKQWVNAAVVWANREGALTVQNPAVAVWEIDRLPEELGNVWQHKPIEETTRARIIEKLTTLCQQRTDEEIE